ncbi:MAG: hypothetical protein RIF33_13195 [Cyclobacteriaceae bacterium]
MKRVGNILVVVAGALLLFHSLLPHAHHSELNEEQHFEEHEMASSLFDYLQLAFHFDPGQNHLEDYQTAGYDLIIISPYLLLGVETTLTTIEPEDDAQEFRPYHRDLRIRYLHRSLSFRGPPESSC